MSHRMKDTDYLAISTRIHAMETRMLTRERMERMIDAKDNSEALKVLEECGYAEPPRMGRNELEDMLSAARGAVFQEIAGAVPEKNLVRVFQLRYDYHNAKVLVKAQARGVDPGPMLLSGGRYSPEELLESWEREELRECSEDYRKALERAKELLAETGDAQQADLSLDRDCALEMTSLAKESGSAFLQGYVQLCMDVSNLRTAVRCARLEKDVDFIARALLPGGSVSERSIASAKGDGLEELYRAGPLSEAAEMGAAMCDPKTGALTRFENLCDNAVTEYVAQAKRVPFGEQTVIGYLYAKEVEVTAIRIIMSGRMAGLSPDLIRSRLRTAYV